MKIPPNDFKTHVWVAAAISFTAYLFFTRSLLLFIPVFAFVIFALWKRGGGQIKSWEDDDPADWWKKGKKWEER